MVIVIVLCLVLAVPCVGLQFMIVICFTCADPESFVRGGPLF